MNILLVLMGISIGGFISAIPFVFYYKKVQNELDMIYVNRDAWREKHHDLTCRIRDLLWAMGNQWEKVSSNIHSLVDDVYSGYTRNGRTEIKVRLGERLNKKVGK